MFKIDKPESTLFNKCGHTANTNGVCSDTSLHLEDSSNVQKISDVYITYGSNRRIFRKLQV